MEMITQSGPRCDVCDLYIFDGMVNFFRVNGANNLICHDRCKQSVLDAKDNWHKLPNGPLREAFATEEAMIPQK